MYRVSNDFPAIVKNIEAAFILRHVDGPLISYRRL